MPGSTKKAASKQKTAGKPKAASSYTYTGCWTCRKRHIKCDESKPACNRCIKAGFECAGYDFKFAGEGAARTFRRPVAPGSNAHHQPALSSAQVTGYLDDLDAATDSAQKGPFSVLSFDASPGPSQRSLDDHDEIKIENKLFLQDRIELDSVSSPGDSGYQSSHGNSNDDFQVARVTPRSVPEVPSMIVEPHLLSVSARQSELFEHWSTFVCNNLSPLSASSANPFRYVYPSLALEGVMAHGDIAGPRMAVWHGLCGTAAWSLSRIKPHDPVYHALSVYHDQQALQHIQQTIARPDGLNDASIPAAIMTCLTGDTISARLDAWGRHLKGGFHCLLSVLQRSASNSTTSVLCEQYLLAASLANIGSPVELRAVQNGIQSSSGSYMEACHCITRPMINVVLATNVLAKSQKRNDPVQIDKIRQTLVKSKPKFQGDATRDHLSLVWYYAITIYFHRTLVHSFDTQRLALRAVEHLEGAAESDETGACGRIMMWPLLTIGLECTTPELRARLFQWCNSQLQARQHVGNVDKFIGLLRETWTIKPLDGTLPFRGIKIEDEADLG